jgi:hypothetical protein
MAAAAGRLPSMNGQQPFETIVATHRATCDWGMGGCLGGVDAKRAPLTLERAI